ncbi:hypothetical protein CKM354_000699800 [Cercospora kikuchii]|uniref:DNA2/NAM7 helicase-like C-terminal domain-containing protein n=1 Tax=Cercospora kikuchii TaxID=84275 RepID=A0A9P3FIE1_9PEZI|nr:uncharacterized protein CKM354_000699800 [Cercospora kikuchii]GIZ43784.1 hypothetical protein CKM354_000699800 [Cercospora kikuchii]
MADPIRSILSHHDSLTDAVTGEGITPETELTALHSPSPGSLLHNLTQTAGPSKACLLVFNNELFPPDGRSHESAKSTFHTEVTFSDLLTIPHVRIEVKWPSLDLQVAVKIRITENNVRVAPNVTRGDHTADELACTSSGSSRLSREGFNNAIAKTNQLCVKSQRLLWHLRALFETDGPKAVRIRFFDTLADDKSSCIPQLLPFVVGPHKLKSLALPDHSQLVPLSVTRTPHELLSSPAPFPFTTLSSGTTYISINDAQAQLFESARIAHVEQDLGLQQWSKVQHEAVPYQLGEFVILAVNFKPFTPLRGSDGSSVAFRLPERMTTKIWSQQTGIEFACSAFLCSSIAMLEGYDALFIVASRVPFALRTACHDISDLNLRTSIMVTFEPRISQFSISSQLATATALRAPDVARWLPIILNQSPHLPYVDLALKRAPDFKGSVDRRQVDRVYEMMLNWRKWNPEQLAALRSVRSAVGSIVLISGPAGTGKTLVQQILCAFFYLIGLHVLVLAPANSNVADFVSKLHKNFPSGDVEALRVFPRSAETDLKDAVGKDATIEPSTSLSPALPPTHLFEFELVRSEVNAAGEKYSKGRESGLQHKVLKTARSGSLDGTLLQPIMDAKGKAISDGKVDMWKELRRCIEMCERGEFDWQDDKLVNIYEQSYSACKCHFIARSRLIVTTTGNVHNPDIQENWAQDMHGVKCKGVVVILDEACKDNEIDTLGPLMCPGFRSKVTGMIMVGDDRQLEPTDTSAKGRVQFSLFPGRSSMPFATRLKKEGHACVELLEQHRMSVRIADWPFTNFYPPGMRSSPKTYRTLREKLPGLRVCLAKTLGKDLGHLSQLYSAVDEDDFLRSHYVQVEGKRVKRNLSTVVREHILAFFNHIFWDLHAYFGTEFHDNVTVIVAYKEARFCWQQASKHLMRIHKLTTRELPNVMTIDSSQGTEATITIVDCSVQQYRKDSDIGFIDDDRRINVAMTRAQEVRWFLGGSCSADERYARRTKLPAYVRYRNHTETTNSLSNFGGEVLPADGAGWLEKLEKRDVLLQKTFVDDMRRLGR